MSGPSAEARVTGKEPRSRVAPSEPSGGSPFERIRGSLSELLRDARTFPADAALGWRERGPRGVAAELKARTLSRVVRYNRLWIIEQDLAAAREPSVPEGVVIRPFEGSDWSVLAGIASSRALERFRKGSLRGRVCLVAWRGNEPVGYTWVSDRVEPDLETFPIPLAPDAAYLWDLYVARGARNGGVGSALVGARLRYARECGFRKGVRAIAPGNRASLKTLEKSAGTGASILGELIRLELFTRTYVRFRPPPVDLLPS